MKLMCVGCGFVLLAALGLPAQSLPGHTHTIASAAGAAPTVMTNTVNKSEAQWRKELTPEQYRVLREKGTEPAFTGQYWNQHAPGIYRCAACGLVLFASEAKFDSGCGWPSFDRPVSTNAVALAEDHSHFMRRTEVLCPRCGGHLGHVFDDGPRETTGQRYCINSLSLKFEPATNPAAAKPGK
jgi:peptide-methionine (R)-S-oxide reductase